MDISIIIAIAAGIILSFIIIKFIAKNIIKFIGITVLVVAFGFYLWYVFGDSQNGNIAKIVSFSPAAIHTAYCEDMKTHSDSLKCECIVEPIYEDLKQRLSADELKSMKNDKIKFITEVRESINNKKQEIKNKLKDRQAGYLWDEFKQEIKNGDIIRRVKEKTNK